MGYSPSEEDVVSDKVASERERYNKAGYNYDD
jgi:hypothetical protein